MHLDNEGLVLPTVGEQCVVVVSFRDCADRIDDDVISGRLSTAADDLERRLGLVAQDYEEGYDSKRVRTQRLSLELGVQVIELLRNVATNSTFPELKVAAQKLVDEYESKFFGE